MPRRRKRPRRLEGAEHRSGRVLLTNHREVARNLTGLRHHGGGGTGATHGADGAGGGAGDGSDLGRRLREAAQVIADQAKENAGWSARIPPSIRVSGGAGGVSIVSDAPPAYPNEIPGVRHPVFGGRGTSRPKAPWVLNQHRPFMAPAADERIDEAAEKFAQVIDDWCEERGYH